jgi:putative hydrolase of the HAD superfamily
VTPRIVCFDLGGVVVRICRSFAEACERAGVPLRDPEWMQSDDAIAARSLLVDAYQRGAMTSEQYLLGMAEAMRGCYSPKELELVHDAWLVEEYSGMLDLVARLDSLPGITTACLSNTNERHWSVLAEGGSTDFPSVTRLRHRFASHLIRSSKPDAEIYLHAERGLRARGAEILFFDDLAHNVDAARSRGWRAELVDPEGSPAEQMASYLRAQGIVL